VAFGTTPNCGAYYQVQDADTCNRISLAAKVSVALFQQINPSIDAECDNLIPDLWYCVHPTYDWNDSDDDDDDDGSSTSTTSTVVSPPAPTPTGTTSQCYKWYTVVVGDNCALLQNTLGVTMAQLMAWNPDLKADCSNLILGDAYCVQGPSSAPTASTTAAASTSTTKATSTSTTKATTTSTTFTTMSTVTTKTTSAAPPTSSTSGSTCAQSYTVVTGDTCSKIWTQYSLTEAQFRALNPTLNANCDINAGHTVCVKGSSASATTVTSAAPTPTSSGSCKTSYAVVLGDTCSKIWAKYGLTEAQFRALNPTLNAACDLREGQVLCLG
jgi:LysM repeat protein